MERLKSALTIKAAAEVLGVTPQTVRNWEAGRSRVPYSAFKLLRILGGYALPGQAWRGFYVRGDTLWSPEGKAFRSADLAWWGLTVAMANTFLEQRRRLRPAGQPQG
jgi:transcriptional regulator with XRE-family HTH domain